MSMRNSRSRSKPNIEGRSYRLLDRVYGEDNAYVRDNIDELENQSERSRTGLVHPERFDYVQYENHHMEPWAKRHMELVEKYNGDLDKAHAKGASEAKKQNLPVEERSVLKRKLEGEKSSWKPMRIYFETSALDQQANGTNQKKINFLEEIILPKAAEFWSQALSVIPVKGDLVINRNDLAENQFCGATEFSQVPNSHTTVGVPDSDLILYVSGNPSSRYCGPSTLAVAVACNFDAFDRPTAGAVNICLDQVRLNNDGTADESTITDNLDVIVHEIGHVLAMSLNHFRFFRHFDGTPRTVRRFEPQQVECVNGQKKTQYLPDRNTLDFYYDGVGSKYAAITTERVRTVTRNHFNCQSLPGAKLENQPTGSSCTGDHWDEKAFYSSTLSGVISADENYLTSMSIALAEDSGWYRGNYTMTRVSPWGHNAGCEFVDNACLQSDPLTGKVSVPEYGRGHFCTQGSQRGCSPGHTHKMACTLVDWNLYHPAIPPPTEFQYFVDQPGRGGPKQADYCPVFGSTYRDLQANELDCRKEQNADFVNLYGEFYGENSMCFETTTGAGRCYQANCILSERKVLVNIRGEWRKCNYDFEELELVSNTGVFEGTVKCPRLSQACPEMFCPANCAGQGVCDYENQVNGVTVPKCNCFAGDDSCIPPVVQLDGKYLPDDSTLQSVVQKGFFDDFVSVFVDHPNTWNKATWGWASGLFVGFLMMILCICSSFWPVTTSSSNQPRKRRRPQRRR